MTDPNLKWRKACATSACIEVAHTAERTLIRVDSTVLVVTVEEWEQFEQGVKDGRFSRGETA